MRMHSRQDHVIGVWDVLIRCSHIVSDMQYVVIVSRLRGVISAILDMRIRHIFSRELHNFRI